MAQLSLPVEYPSFLEELKARIQSAQIKAALSINQQLLALYWDLGKLLVERLRTSGWGEAIVEQLSKDLSAAFPDLKGFSRTKFICHAAVVLVLRAGRHCPTSCGINSLYALRDMNKPIGIAEYRITEAIPAHLRTELPTIEELEAELRKGSNA